MKKKLLLLIAITVCNFTFSQFNPKLDVKNGFQTFKFGDLKSKYKGKIKHEGDNFYKYTYSYPNSLFNKKWDNLILRFFNNKLGYIHIQYKSNNEYTYKIILGDLEAIFGKSYTFSDTDIAINNEIFRNQWEGQDVSLAMIMYNEKSALRGDYYINIIISNKHIREDALNSQF
jgi:hypothetical protein